MEDVRRLADQFITQVAPPPAATDFQESATIPPEVTSTPQEQETPTPPLPSPLELILWLPPQFDPDDGSAASSLLKARIAAFEAQNRDVFVTTRIKPAAGPTGLLEALSITNAAAPAAMPSLIALSRSDLEAAVARKLVYPFDSLSSAIDSEDWYPYAPNLTLIGGSSYGLPFAGDALMLLYRPEEIGKAPVNWDEILRRGEPLSFPAADPQALVTFAMYQSANGDLENTQRMPTLDLELLTRLFQLYADGGQSGAFPLWVTQFQKDTDAWTAYNELRSDWVLTWSTRFLQSPQPDTAAVLFPALGDTPLSLVDGWVWCLTDPRQAAHPLAVQLAEFLTSADFLAEWNAAAGVLPVRPSSLAGWDDQKLKILLGETALSAKVKPRNEIINSLGAILQEQVVLILTGKTTAPIAAQTVMDKMGNP